MKKTLLFFFLSTLSLNASATYLKLSTGVSGLSGDIKFETAPLNEWQRLSSGWNKSTFGPVNLAIGFNTTSNFNLELEFSYDNKEFYFNSLDTYSGLKEEEVTDLINYTIGVNGLYTLVDNKWASPYIGVGLSLGVIQASATKSSASNDEDEIGFSGLIIKPTLGVKAKINNTFTFSLEYRYETTVVDADFGSDSPGYEISNSSILFGTSIQL